MIKRLLPLIVLTCLGHITLAQIYVTTCEGDTTVLNSEEGIHQEWSIYNDAHRSWQFSDEQSLLLHDFAGRVVGFRKVDDCTVDQSDTLYFKRAGNLSDYLNQDEGIFDLFEISTNTPRNDISQSDREFRFELDKGGRLYEFNLKDTIYLKKRHKSLIGGFSKDLDIQWKALEIDYSIPGALPQPFDSVGLNDEVNKIPIDFTMMSKLRRFETPYDAYRFNDNIFGQYEVAWEACDTVQSSPGISFSLELDNYLHCLNEKDDSLGQVCFYISGSVIPIEAGLEPGKYIGVVNHDTVVSPPLSLEVEFQSQSLPPNFRDTSLLMTLIIPSLAPGQDFSITSLDSITWPFYLPTDKYLLKSIWRDTSGFFLGEKSVVLDYVNEFTSGEIELSMRTFGRRKPHFFLNTGPNRFGETGIDPPYDTLAYGEKVYDGERRYVEITIINKSEHFLTSLTYDDPALDLFQRVKGQFTSVTRVGDTKKIFNLWPNDTLTIGVFTQIDSLAALNIVNPIGDTVASMKYSDYYTPSDSVIYFDKFGYVVNDMAVAFDPTISEDFDADSVPLSIVIGRKERLEVRIGNLRTRSILDLSSLVPYETTLDLMLTDVGSGQTKMIGQIPVSWDENDVQFNQWLFKSLIAEEDGFDFSADSLRSFFPHSTEFIGSIVPGFPTVSPGHFIDQNSIPFRRFNLKIDTLFDQALNISTEVSFLSFNGSEVQPSILNEGDQVNVEVQVINGNDFEVNGPFNVGAYSSRFTEESAQEIVAERVEGNRRLDPNRLDLLNVFGTAEVSGIAAGDTARVPFTVTYTDSSRSFIFSLDPEGKTCQLNTEDDDVVYSSNATYCNSGIWLNPSIVALTFNGENILNQFQGFTAIPEGSDLVATIRFENKGNRAMNAFNAKLSYGDFPALEDATKAFGDFNLPFTTVDSFEVASIDPFSFVDKEVTFTPSGLGTIGMGMKMQLTTDAAETNDLCGPSVTGATRRFSNIVNGASSVVVADIGIVDTIINCGSVANIRVVLKNLSDVPEPDSVFVDVRTLSGDNTRFGIAGLEAQERREVSIELPLFANGANGAMQGVTFNVSLDLSQTANGENANYSFTRPITFRFVNRSIIIEGFERTLFRWKEVDSLNSYTYSIIEDFGPDNTNLILSGTTSNTSVSYSALNYGTPYKAQVIASDDHCRYYEASSSRRFQRPFVPPKPSGPSPTPGNGGGDSGGDPGGPGSSGTCWWEGNKSNIISSWENEGDRYTLQLKNIYDFPIWVTWGIELKDGRYSKYADDINPGQTIKQSYFAVDLYTGFLKVGVRRKAERWTCRLPNF